MKINTEHLLTNPDQVSQIPSFKKQILLAHTSSTMDEYFTKITTRWNGSYDGSFTFTIGLDGTIYEHYNPQLYSSIFRIPEIDTKLISVGLENVGWLACKSVEGSDFFDWKGSIYRGKTVDKIWRGRTVWAAYSDKQVNSLIWLLRKLIDAHKIERAFSGNNLPMENAKDFSGVLLRSNYTKFCYDLSPAFNGYFGQIKEAIL